MPSIYFIEKGGKPIKIVTEVPDAASLSKDIAEVLRLAGISASSSTSAGLYLTKPFVAKIQKIKLAASADLISSEQTASAGNVVCENGVCTIKRDPPAVDRTSEGDRLAAEDKVERAKKLLEAKRLAAEKAEKEVELGGRVGALRVLTVCLGGAAARVGAPPAGAEGAQTARGPDDEAAQRGEGPCSGANRAGQGGKGSKIQAYSRFHSHWL